MAFNRVDIIMGNNVAQQHMVKFCHSEFNKNVSSGSGAIARQVDRHGPHIKYKVLCKKSA